MLSRRLRELALGAGWPRRRQLAALAVVLGALSIGLYARTLWGPFLWDSEEAVLHDPAVRSLANVPSFFRHSSEPPQEYASVVVSSLKYYRPLAKTLIALEYAVFHERPVGYHLVNLLLNATLVALFFLLVHGVTGDRRIALAAGVLYAVNPARGEAVNWIYSASSLLEGALAMAALLLHHRGRRWLALAAFGAALLAREEALLLVPVVVAFEVLVRVEVTWRERLRRCLPYAIVGAGFLVLRTVVVGGLPPPPSGSPLTTCNTIAVVVKRLLKLTIMPDAPVAHYRLELFPRLSAEVLVAYGVLALAGFGLVVVWRRYAAWRFWYVWPFLWMAVAFNVGGAGEYLLAEKVMLVAVGGLCVLAAAALARVPHGMVVVAVAAALHGGVTFARTAYWIDEVTHFEALLRFSPTHWQARYSLGHQLGERGELAAAARHLELVLTGHPDHSSTLNNLGNCYFGLGDRARAEAAWTRALATDPRNGKAACNLGMLAEQRGELAPALARYRECAAKLEGDPAIVARVRRLEALLGGR